jgi:hypothetical protein
MTNEKALWGSALWRGTVNAYRHLYYTTECPIFSNEFSGGT